MTNNRNFSSKKRRYGGGNRRHDRNKFIRISNPSVRKSNLTAGLTGILFSCTPHREDRAFREGVLLLHRHYEALTSDKQQKEQQEQKEVSSDIGNNSDKKEGEFKKDDDKKAEEGGKKTTLQSLDDELNQMRQNATRNADDTGMFTRVDTTVAGAIFIQFSTSTAPSTSSPSENTSPPPAVQVKPHTLVERALRDARASGIPGTKYCARMIPVHSTCYAKPEEAANAAQTVAREHFLPLLTSSSSSETKTDEKGKPSLTFAIAFRSRCNSGVHRDDYIPPIAEAVLSLDKQRISVNLTKPDVTLVVEILKTCCYIGAFVPYYELAKLNLHEAACPTVKTNNKVSEKHNDQNQEQKQGEREQQSEKTGNGVTTNGGEKHHLIDAKEGNEGNQSETKAENGEHTNKENGKEDVEKSIEGNCTSENGTSTDKHNGETRSDQSVEGDGTVKAEPNETSKKSSENGQHCNATEN